MSLRERVDAVGAARDRAQRAVPVRDAGDAESGGDARVATSKRVTMPPAVTTASAVSFHPVGGSGAQDRLAEVADELRRDHSLARTSACAERSARSRAAERAL